MIAVIGALWLAGCEQKVGYRPPPETVVLEDRDEDGILSNEDCDDSDPEVGSSLVWYLDEDGDGYGDVSTAEQTCEALDGYVEDAGDCDDGDAEINPGALEFWYDGVDQNCDGADDYDADGDGYTSSEHDGGDCDDYDEAVHPDAPEICSNQEDDNCDGTSYPCSYYGDYTLDKAALVIEAESHHGWFGWSVSTAGDFNGDGTPDLVVGAPESSPEGSSSGTVYVVAGPITEAASVGALKLAEYQGSAAKHYLGGAVAGGGDVDGDGFDDVLFGAIGTDDLGTNSGDVHLAFGGVSGSWSVDGSAAGLSTWEGEGDGDIYDEAGASVAMLDDLNGDGLADLLVGAPGAGGDERDAGAVYIILDSPPGTNVLWYADVKLRGERTYDAAGAGVSEAGDLDGDGVGDFLIGAPADGDAAAGVTYVFQHLPGGDVSLSSADAQLMGERFNERSGSAIDGVGDADGDGYNDILIGAPGNDINGEDAGAAYLLLGPFDGDRILTEGAEAVIYGEEANDQAGISVCGPGDLDSDGRGDLLVGAPLAGPSETGMVALSYGGVSGIFEVDEVDALLLGTLNGELAGQSLDGVGDITGDGVDDFLIGAYRYVGPSYDGGGLYVMPGGEGI